MILLVVGILIFIKVVDLYVEGIVDMYNNFPDYNGKDFINEEDEK